MNIQKFRSHITGAHGNVAPGCLFILFAFGVMWFLLWVMSNTVEEAKVAEQKQEAESHAEFVSENPLPVESDAVPSAAGQVQAPAPANIPAQSEMCIVKVGGKLKLPIEHGLYLEGHSWWDGSPIFKNVVQGAAGKEPTSTKKKIETLHKKDDYQYGKIDLRQEFSIPYILTVYKSTKKQIEYTVAPATD